MASAFFRMKKLSVLCDEVYLPERVVQFLSRERLLKKVVVLSDQSVVMLFVPLAEIGKDLIPSLIAYSRNGEKLKEMSLSEIKTKPRNVLFIGDREIAWLAGPFENDRIILAYAQPPDAEKHQHWVVSIFDSKLENRRDLRFENAFDQWAILAVGRLNDSRLYVVGGHDGKIAVAICSLDGEVLSTIEAEPPANCYDAKVWSDGESRLCLFAQTLEKVPNVGFLKQGTVYGFKVVTE